MKKAATKVINKKLHWGINIQNRKLITQINHETLIESIIGWLRYSKTMQIFGNFCEVLQYLVEYQ